MKTGTFLLAILYLAGSFLQLALGKEKGCEFNLDNRSGKYKPFLLQENGLKFIYPVESRIITFDNMAKFHLFCHETERRSNYLKNFGGLGFTRDTLKATFECKNGHFHHGDKAVSVDDLLAASCKRILEPRIVTRETNSNCGNGFGADGRDNAEKYTELVDVGWNVGNTFVSQISACIDNLRMGTLWTKHVVHGASIDLRDKSAGRPSFRADTRGFTGKRQRFFWKLPEEKSKLTSSALNKIYKKTSQAARVKKLLGTKIFENGDTIIDTSSSGTFYLAKGHLSPDAAFVDEAEQDATYFFFNVAPQFQAFNNRNWKSLEEYVRKSSSSEKDDWTVCSGTHEVLSYPHKNGTMVDIYLENGHLIPVPKYYWKIICNRNTNEAMTFIGLNDPHSQDIAADKTVCNSQCPDVPGVSWDYEAEEKGHMSCCTVDDLKNVVKTLSIDECGCQGAQPMLEDTA